MITIKWRVRLARNVNKQLKKLPAKIQELALEAIDDLIAEGPIPRRWNVRNGREIT